VTLVLKRASTSLPPAGGDDDDFDVLADLAVVGCIMKAAAAPVGAPWLWTLAFGHHEDHTPTHGGCDVIVRQELAAGMRNAAGRAPLTGTEARTLARVRGASF
jgi:hypothetical protein